MQRLITLEFSPAKPLVCRGDDNPLFMFPPVVDCGRQMFEEWWSRKMGDDMREDEVHKEHMFHRYCQQYDLPLKEEKSFSLTNPLDLCEEGQLSWSQYISLLTKSDLNCDDILRLLFHVISGRVVEHQDALKKATYRHGEVEVPEDSTKYRNSNVITPADFARFLGYDVSGESTSPDVFSAAAETSFVQFVEWVEVTRLKIIDSFKTNSKISDENPCSNVEVFSLIFGGYDTKFLELSTLLKIEVKTETVACDSNINEDESADCDSDINEDEV